MNQPSACLPPPERLFRLSAEAWPTDYLPVVYSEGGERMKSTDRTQHGTSLALIAGHPLRAKIWFVLSGAAASPKELAARLGAEIGVVAYHVRVLHKGGVLELVETQKVRGAIEHFYTATERPHFTE